MGSTGIKRRKHRVMSAKGPKTSPVREAPLPRKQLAERKQYESPLSWIFDCLGEKHVVLLVKRGEIYMNDSFFILNLL